MSMFEMHPDAAPIDFRCFATSKTLRTKYALPTPGLASIEPVPRGRLMNLLDATMVAISTLWAGPDLATAQPSKERGGLQQSESSSSPLHAFSGPFAANGAKPSGGDGLNPAGCKPQRSSAPPAHIVVVVEENRGFLQIIGNPNAAYINSLAATGMLFTEYHALAHPSQPNYFALFSGSTQGATGDGDYFFPDTPTLAGELRHAGYSFVGYAESSAERDHSPWLSFGDSQRAGQPFSRFPTDYNELPAVAFISPDAQHNMHDGTIAQADRWLNANLSAFAHWAMGHDSMLVVTFDEDQGTRDNRVATLVVGARIPSGRSTQRLDHYSLLHTIEVLYGLPPLGASAAAPVMDFALTPSPCTK
ncbi:MAG: hypothetical protein JOZ66_15135 [Hyphomicrobiales bacterium]|nr:hypothetical protein [Hyphomicrobiales bacterium]